MRILEGFCLEFISYGQLDRHLLISQVMICCCMICFSHPFIRISSQSHLSPNHHLIFMTTSPHPPFTEAQILSGPRLSFKSLGPGCHYISLKKDQDYFAILFTGLLVMLISLIPAGFYFESDHYIQVSSHRISFILIISNYHYRESYSVL